MKMLKKLCITFGLLFTLVAGSIVFLGYHEYQQAYEEVSLQEKVSECRSIEGYTNLVSLPSLYIDAVVSVEDQEFYDHNGISLKAILRAVVVNVTKQQIVEGGSTITQQLGKNLFFSQDKNFVRKVSEVFVAFDLEKTYTKSEILELYVNSIYFGDGYMGIGQASRGYFGVEPYQLSDAQCVILAGIPNAPSVYSPSNNSTLCKQRAYQVLLAMVDNGTLQESDAQRIRQEIESMAL